MKEGRIGYTCELSEEYAAAVRERMRKIDEQPCLTPLEDEPEAESQSGPVDLFAVAT